jgi:predicted Fe-Mo cluster-binding NifX family protein
MKIAIPIWQNRVAPVFDTIQSITLFGAEQSEQESHEIGLANLSSEQKVQILIARGVDTLICGALPFRYENQLIQHGIAVYPFIAGEVTDILTAYRSGNLDSAVYKMPGCKKRAQRGRNCRFKQSEVER